MEFAPKFHQFISSLRTLDAMFHRGYFTQEFSGLRHLRDHQGSLCVVRSPLMSSVQTKGGSSSSIRYRYPIEVGLINTETTRVCCGEVNLSVVNHFRTTNQKPTVLPMPFLVHSYISQIHASDYEEYVRIALRTFQSYEQCNRTSGIANFNMWSEFHQQNTVCDFTATMENLNATNFSHLIDAMPCGSSITQALLRDVDLMREKLSSSGGPEILTLAETEMPLRQHGGRTSEASDIFVNLIREVFENAAISLDSSLHELGMSSQQVFQATDRLRTELGERVPVTAFYDFATLREIYGHMRPDDILAISTKESSVVTEEKRLSQVRSRRFSLRELAQTRQNHFHPVSHIGSSNCVKTVPPRSLHQNQECTHLQHRRPSCALSSQLTSPKPVLASGRSQGGDRPSLIRKIIQCIQPHRSEDEDPLLNGQFTTLQLASELFRDVTAMTSPCFKQLSHISKLAQAPFSLPTLNGSLQMCFSRRNQQHTLNLCRSRHVQDSFGDATAMSGPCFQSLPRISKLVRAPCSRPIVSCSLQTCSRLGPRCKVNTADTIQSFTQFCQGSQDFTSLSGSRNVQAFFGNVGSATNCSMASYSTVQGNMNKLGTPRRIGRFCQRNQQHTSNYCRSKNVQDLFCDAVAMSVPCFRSLPRISKLVPAPCSRPSQVSCSLQACWRLGPRCKLNIIPRTAQVCDGTQTLAAFMGSSDVQGSVGDARVMSGPCFKSSPRTCPRPTVRSSVQRCSRLGPRSTISTASTFRSSRQFCKGSQDFGFTRRKNGQDAPEDCVESSSQDALKDCMSLNRRYRMHEFSPAAGDVYPRAVSIGSHGHKVIPFRNEKINNLLCLDRVGREKMNENLVQESFPAAHPIENTEEPGINVYFSMGAVEFRLKPEFLFPPFSPRASLTFIHPMRSGPQEGCTSVKKLGLALLPRLLSHARARDTVIGGISLGGMLAFELLQQIELCTTSVRAAFELDIRSFMPMLRNTMDPTVSGRLPIWGAAECPRIRFVSATVHFVTTLGVVSYLNIRETDTLQGDAVVFKGRALYTEPVDVHVLESTSHGDLSKNRAWDIAKYLKATCAP